MCTDGGVAGREASYSRDVPSLGIWGRRGQRAFSNAYPTRCGPSCLPPSHSANGPSGPPRCQLTGPEDPRHAGSNARGRATTRTAAFQGFGSTDLGGDPGLAELARLWLYLCVVNYRGPACPRSGSCRSAVLMEMQSEPLASAASAATRPARATAATPLTTASTTPLTTRTRRFIGRLNRGSTSPALSLHPEDSPLVGGAAPQDLSEDNWLLLTSLACGPRPYWIRPARRGRNREEG